MYVVSRLAVLCLCSFISPALGETFPDAFPNYYADLLPEYKAGVGALELLHGTVIIDGGKAEIALPDEFYMLNAKDARYVLETLWNNPPDPSILGLIARAGENPLQSESWAATVSFDGMGYVSDADADSYNYDDLLANLQKNVHDSNPDRIKQGYDSIEILGWAATPHYDKETRKLYWAKRLQFSNTPTETLNYDIRILGREGVMVVGFIADMAQLPAVEAAAPAVLKMINFTEGNRYTDYVPGVDTVAAVGIGGLIGAKLAAKTGLLIVLLAFLKKGFVLVLVVGAALVSKLRSFLFGRKAETTARNDPSAKAKDDDQV